MSIVSLIIAPHIHVDGGMKIDKARLLMQGQKIENCDMNKMDMGNCKMDLCMKMTPEECAVYCDSMKCTPEQKAACQEMLKNCKMNMGVCMEGCKKGCKSAEECKTSCGEECVKAHETKAKCCPEGKEKGKCADMK